MREKVIATIIMVILILPVCANASSVAIAVLPFNVSKVGNPALGEDALNSMTEALLDWGFRIVERQKIKTIMKELELSLSGAVDEDKMLQVGRMSSAKYIMSGTLTNANILNQEQSSFMQRAWIQNIQATVSVRVIDVESGEIVFVKRETARMSRKSESSVPPMYDQSLLTEAIDMATVRIAEKMARRLK